MSKRHAAGKSLSASFSAISDGEDVIPREKENSKEKIIC
jgi:hypothetical protein